MKYSTNSIHAKLYKFTYNSDLPTNLCPYFWKLVIASIFFIPQFILRIPFWIFKKQIGKKSSYEKYYNPIERTLLGILLYFVALILIFLFISNYELIRAMFHMYEYDYASADCGILFDSIILIIMFSYFIAEFYTYKKYKPYTKKEPSIVKEFIKAKYYKYCPTIEWKEKNNQ